MGVRTHIVEKVEDSVFSMVFPTAFGIARILRCNSPISRSAARSVMTKESSNLKRGE